MTSQLEDANPQEIVTYEAQDDDLPSIFWDGSAEPLSSSTAEELAKRMVAVAVHYPTTTPTEQERIDARMERERRKNARLDINENRKIWVKRAKREQMWNWLEGLDAQGEFGRMSPRESHFSTSLLKKFRTYGNRTKWITRRQYDWLQAIAAKSLRLA